MSHSARTTKSSDDKVISIAEPSTHTTRPDPSSSSAWALLLLSMSLATTP